MKLIILDTNIFARILLGFKQYEKLLRLINQGTVKILVHSVILAETFSVLLKVKENELFGRVNRERISLSLGAREEVLEDLRRRIAKLNVDVVIIGRDEVGEIIEKIKDVCISAFDALTLVVTDKVKPDLIATDDRLFRNRAFERGYKICSEEELYEKLELT